MFKKHRWLRWLAYFAVAVLLFYLLLLVLFRPSHERDWELGHEALPHVSYSSAGNEITIDNYRNFEWTAVKSADVKYEIRTFDLDEMTGVDVFISHFDDFEGLAHIFLSFGFVDGKNIVVSLETRRESDETFSPLLGILRQFEIIYVVGSEEDIVGVRTGHRNERVYLYPTKATPDQARELFNLIAREVNDVYESPRMYNTLTHNCTNELTRPVEKMSDVDFPLTWKTILPGFFDEILYELELIDSSLPFAEVKKNHFIDNSKVDVKSETYSQDLRRSIGILND
ncbi:DUF4105 domain-containing protein [Candidatus Kaiserbacteria bacterium]|nr:DUF4105 domain-containing protein [Candidatus Kaiserbacteria bacterium]USN92346.1 MAG: DUF4105 domain-containing protein [Candidatus Nomurabacteria bacterium]